MLQGFLDDFFLSGALLRIVTINFNTPADELFARMSQRGSLRFVDVSNVAGKVRNRYPVFYLVQNKRLEAYLFLRFFPSLDFLDQKTVPK
ncbi:MAG: hypothetical protein A4E66_00600 [Syntrophus sp. PtaB.Bin001]|nr:MAG: hypothetical protein A4E66_00600 [Syntrophus sp. PtaB.Bin001]